MTKYYSILLPHTYKPTWYQNILPIKLHSLYHLLSCLVVCLQILWPKLFLISCSHGQSKYRAWSHPNISLSFNYFLKQITNIFVTEANTVTNIYALKVRGDYYWDWNEAVTKHEFIVTIWAKVSVYSLHPRMVQ